MNIRNYTCAIEANFPAFHVRAVEIAGEGMDSVALTVNGDYIFRFPKFPEVADKLRVEAELLPRLRPYLDVEVPQFEFTGRQPESGLPFVGYRKIEGVRLSRALLESLDIALREWLIMSIAGFLNRLHSFPVEIARDCGVGAPDFRASYAEVMKSAQAALYPILEPSAQAYLEKLFEGYLSSEMNFDYTPALLHGDLWPGHILYDEKRQDIAGVIDFGDVLIGDPHYDLAFLHQSCGRQFTESLLRHVPCSDQGILLDKLQFFIEANEVRDALLGLHRGDDALLRDCAAYHFPRRMRYSSWCSRASPRPPARGPCCLPLTTMLESKCP